ncbi:MAG: FAD-dependent oxidoreductase [Sphingomonadales bacterium]
MKMLTPIKIGPMAVKNRVVSTAHAAFLDFFRPGSGGERYMAYQERRAEGGTGLIIMTAMHVHHSSQLPNHFVYDPDDMAPKFQRMSQRVHRHGAKLISQLFHFGVQGTSNCRDDFTPLWGFSPRISREGEACHEMTGDEIEEVIQAFVDAAVCATSNGVDGVELHGTHGYLIQESFSPYANQRQDKWGQPLYFVKTLAGRVRDAIGPDKVLGFRISVDDFIAPGHGGVGPEGLRQIARDLIATGAFDYLNHSEGAGGPHYARAIGSFRYGFGEWLPLTKALREAIDGAVPLIGVSKIPTPDLAERALEQGYCDLVGMTRAQIADPDMVAKLQAGQGHRIRPCTGSNQGCIDRVSLFPITCFHNPEVGEEDRFKKLAQIKPTPKRVLVVGGGPAGMKASEVAARRGHDVTLAEAGPRLGGRLNLVAAFGDSSNLLSATAWVEQELALLKVKILTQTLVDDVFLAAFEPDAIIMATGAVSNNDLGVTSDESIPILSSDDAASGTFQGVKFDICGTRTLVVDIRANYETALVIESLAKRGSKVTVATPHLHFGANMGFTHLTDYLGLLPKWSVDVHATTLLDRVADGSAYLKQAFSGATVAESYDFIVAGTPPQPRKEFYEAFQRHARDIRLVGDVVAPRSALEAFREGDRAGRTI